MNIGAMAARNIWRNTHRTVTTVGAMAFAGGLMILYSSLLAGFLEVFERNAVGMDTGDIQIHAEGYLDDPDLYNRVEDSEKIVERLNEAGLAAAPRLYGFALAAAGDASSGVTLRGVDVEREAAATLIHNHVMKGRWMDTRDPRGVVIGRKLARTLNVGVGSEVVLLSQAADGSMANDLYEVRGILKSVKEGIDRGGVFMTADEFRRLMALPEGAHEIAVSRRGSAMGLAEAAERVEAAAPGLDVRTWRRLNPVVARMLDISDSSMFIMLLITYTAIAMVTLNAMLMSVFERIPEFGVMKAIGVTPWQILLLVFGEGLAQAVMASLIALAAGLAASWYFQVHGIDLSALTGETGMAAVAGVAFDPVWHAKLTAEAAIVPLAVLVAIAQLAAIYPGVKAALIRPVQAIHHI
ncbi:MAG: ABC transporter permease [Candidatus Nitrospinota bacterium M3_3B_026]